MDEIYPPECSAESEGTTFFHVFPEFLDVNKTGIYAISYYICRQRQGVCICPDRVVDILEACGAFDPGSSPGRGVRKG